MRTPLDFSDNIEDSTRDRILRAAILRFAAQSYETMGLRDVAADVGITVAYVHRCFGSKEKLFAECIRATLKPSRLFSDGTEDLATKLARDVLRPRAEGEVMPLDIVLRSISSPAVSKILRDFAETEFIGPMADTLGHRSRTRAAVATALLAGVGILSHVVNVTLFAEADREELAQVTAHALKSIIGTESGES